MKWESPLKFTDPDGRATQNNNIVAFVIRDISSYKTIGGNNPELKGQDSILIMNYATNESIKIPVSSVPNMTGTVEGDALAPGPFQLKLGPSEGSKYSPDVLTISEGTLMSGAKLNPDGTTNNNEIPWRAHDTKNWGSAGCLTGQRNNPEGDVKAVVDKLKSWGLKYGDTIPGVVTETNKNFWGDIWKSITDFFAPKKAEE